MDGFISFLVIFILYLIPLWIAIGRRKRNVVAIGTTNFLLGWTLIGWIVPFIWSLTKDNN